jgi:Ca2+-transporting ATPase
MAILPEEFPVIMTVFLALGAWRLSKTNVLTRKSSAIETLGSATVLCSDKTGTITCNKMVVGAVVPSAIEGENRLMVFAKLACFAHAHDPMERAIHEYGTKDIHRRALSLEREYALSSKLTAMTLVYKESAGRIIATKGAPETLFHLCHLNEQEMKAWQEKLTLLARKGMRILGVAEGRIDSASLPETQEGFSFSFLGLVAFSDPVRPEVSDTINECRTAGIRIIMLTGDHPETAATIGSEIGLSSAELLIGSDIHALTDEQLRQGLAHTEIIARLKPEQKLRIVLALQASGEIVAMTGDGVNDAPALKAANIGVAMGLKGTDVAREASSLVLLDDNFNSIVRAIRSGRRIHDNLQKAMSYVLAIHIPIIGLTLLPAFVPSLALILLPLHIVFLELIIDPVSSIAFESEAEEKDIMKHPPRKSNTRFFGKTEITQSIVDGLLLFGCVLVVYLLSRYGGRSELQLRSITFIALVTSNLLMVLSKLSMTRSILYSFTSRNKSAKFIFLAAIILMIIVFCVPEISAIFHMTYPGHLDTFYAICAALVFTICLEILKVIRRKKKSFVATQNL